MVVGDPAPLPCHHKMVVGEITRSRQLVERLRSIVMPPVAAATGRWPELEIVGDLFEEVLQSYKVSVSMILHPCSCLNAGESAVQKVVEEKSGEERPERTSEDNYATDSRKEQVPKARSMPAVHSDGHQWRKAGKKKPTNVDISREEVQSWTTITQAPHFDGHQWRKYGEKHITNSQFPRNYYRCSNSKEQGCLATKTIQQKDGSYDPASFVVKYKLQHTCKPAEAIYSQLVESTSQKRAPLLSFVPKNTTNTTTSPQRKPRECSTSSSSSSPMLIDLNLTIQFTG